MNKLDTIIFDLDGTLIDTNQIIIDSFKTTFEKHLPEEKITLEDIKTFIGPTLQQTFGEYTKDPFLIQDMIDTYRTHYVENEMGSFKIYPNVTEVLKKLKSQNYNLAILTSKFKEAAWPSFTHYQLDEIFDVFISLDDVQNPKPHKDAVNTVLSHFPESNVAIMIGDNQGDILAGKNADIYSAGVAWSLKGSAHLMEVNPDFMLSDMEDIYRVIKIINEGER